MRFLIAFIIAVIAIFHANAQTHAHSAQKGRMGSHGMVLFTDGTALYASHLPLYRRPHDYQIVVSIETPHKSDIIKTLQQRQADLQLLKTESMLTLLPDNFDLNRLIEGDAFEINGTVFDGHFERGGKPWKQNQTIKFNNLVWVSPIELKEHALHLSTDQTTWFVIALETVDAYLFLHRIDTRPSFDAIVIGEKCDVKNKQQSVSLPVSTHNSYLPNLSHVCASSHPRYIETQDFR